MPKLPEIRLMRKEVATTKGTDGFSRFSLRCKFSTAKEANVMYALQWVINGVARGIMSFSSIDASEYESALTDDYLKSFLKIDQVSENFLTTSAI